MSQGVHPSQVEQADLPADSNVAQPPFEIPLPPAIIGSLSPSRASDFKTCPLLYRFRSIDRLPETPTRDATRGTVVHAVLEHLYDLPAADRTLERAQAAVAPEWLALLAERPELAQLFPGAEEFEPAVEVAPANEAGSPDRAASPDEVAPANETADIAPDSELGQWLESARRLVANYFALEDPRLLEPEAREQLVEVVLDGLRLRGYIDRLDVSPAGDLRIVDYKTGSIPREAFEAKALFQMKFYALVLWRTRGVVPRQLRLMYLADTDTLSYQPDMQELARFEKTLQAIWKAIATASMTGDFRASPSRLCGWCSHQLLCPAKGGIPPPFPVDALAATTDQAPDRGAVATEQMNSGSAELSHPSRAVAPVL